MQHFPIFLDLRGHRLVVSGAGEAALAKLRLLTKTEARISVFGTDPIPQIQDLSDRGQIRLVARPLELPDILCARLVYAANEDETEDARIKETAHAAGVLVNIVDNLQASEFITPAIVDRDPVTVAIGTEGTAPVLARRIKADIEALLPGYLGPLASAARLFRSRATALPAGRQRRGFWERFFSKVGPQVMQRNGEAALDDALEKMLASERIKPAPDLPGVSFVGAGPGDPELLTLKARRLLHEADVVIHDRLVAAPILELARREAIILEVGKKPYGKSWKQTDINDLMIDHAQAGHHVVRLKSGDPGIFGRLDEELTALRSAGIPHDITPGITSASAAAADAGVSLTSRDRNSQLKVLTGHDVDGFAEQDWAGLARPDAGAAIYMGLRAARFVQGRLLMHGAAPQTPVTIVENASRATRKVVATTIADLTETIDEAGINGPAVILLGMAARTEAALPVPQTPHVSRSTHGAELR